MNPGTVRCAQCENRASLSDHSVGAEVVIDLPISDRLHGEHGVIEYAYNLQQDSWWVRVYSYPPDAGPLWFRSSELRVVAREALNGGEA